MSDPIRIVHFADVHIGMENYGRIDPSTGTSTRVRDFLDRLTYTSILELTLLAAVTPNRVETAALEAAKRPV